MDELKESTFNVSASSSSSSENVSDYDFIEFTKESYQRLVDREKLLKSLETKRARYARGEAHLVDGELRFGEEFDDSILPPTNPDLKEGNVFVKSYGMFPPNLLGVPIEEIDMGIREKTFVVISSAYKKKYINRFTASKSLFIFPVWNPIRKIAIKLATHQIFDWFIILTIIVNCAFMAMPSLPEAEKLEYVFLSIYVVECIVKIVARGFVLSPYTYLRDHWNWLDFSVICVALITLMIQWLNPHVTLKDTRGLRTFRVLRALKTVSILPGLKTIVAALLRALKMLFEVIVLTFFALMIFALSGQQAYSGVFRNKCVQKVSGYDPYHHSSLGYDDYYLDWIKNPDHWYKIENEYVVCGNRTDSGLCPNEYICIGNIGDNPRYGLLNFDHFGWALLTSFQLLTLDYWEDILNKILRSQGPWSILFFVMLTYLGSFYLLNLMLAVVSMSYEEEAVTAVKEREQDKKEYARIKHQNQYTGSQILVNSAFKSFPKRRTKMSGNISKLNENASAVPSDSYMPQNFRTVKRTLSTRFGSPSRDRLKVKTTIIKADYLVDEQIGVLPNHVIDRNCNCCEKWVCGYTGILRFQNYVFAFIMDPLFDFIMIIITLLNTFIMALEFHEQPYYLTVIMEHSDYVFTIIFNLEAILKITGMGKYYFMSGWNIFDCLTALINSIDLTYLNFNGLDVLRTFRMFRVLKLAQSWPTMRLLVTVILSTLGALGNLCLILFIVLYIFAVIGMQLFRENYMKYHFDDEYPSPRWNFIDFYHSMLMIFRILCGEWIEALYQCYRAYEEQCFMVFLPALVIGNFVVLNLFLALLLNAFARDSVDKPKDTTLEKSKLIEGWNRLKQLLLCSCIINRGKASRLEDISTDDFIVPCTILPSQSAANIQPTLLMDNNSNHVNKTSRETSQCQPGSSPIQDQESARGSTQSSIYSIDLDQNNSSNTNINNEYQHEITTDELDMTLKSWRRSTFLSGYSDESAHQPFTTLGRGKRYKGTENEPPPDCCPDNIAKKLGFLNCLEGSIPWKRMRILGKKIVDHEYFECAIFVLILASSVALVFEDYYIYEKPNLEKVLRVCNFMFALIFLCEMILRSLAIGCYSYFTNVWTVLDFVIILISIFSVIGDFIHSSNISAFKSLRTLRAIRPIRAVSRWHGMKIVVNALINAIPAIMNVFLVCMVFWLIFSIMGVQFFKGIFYRCVDLKSQEMFPASQVKTRNDCFAVNGSWANLKINFDSTPNGFLALFQVATFEGWMELMSAAEDSIGEGLQPIYQARPWAYLYFVVFIVVGSFFSLNLFIGVIIDNFNVLKKKYEGTYVDEFLSQGQRNYYTTLKKIAMRKPKKTVTVPQSKLLQPFYKMAVSSRLEMGIVLMILLNMITVAVSHYRQSKILTQLIDMGLMFFTTIFGLEIVVKMIGLRIHFFRFVWNIIDLLIAILSVLVTLTIDEEGKLIGKGIVGYLQLVHITPTLMRISRIFHIGRVLRMIRSAKGIRKLLFAMVTSLPAVANIGALLFLIMFIYATFGMYLFNTVKINGVFDELINFRTFGNSYLIMLRLSLAAGWNEILDALMISEPYCNKDFYTLPNGVKKLSSHGDCGNPYLAIPFMVSYIFLVFFILVNMYIAVLLENFNQAHLQEEVGVTEDDFDMFYMVWEKYDPGATEFIKYEQLGDFVADLDPPLQRCRPNEITLVHMNIPILEGERIHCIDILVALIKSIITDVEASNELHALLLQIEDTYAKMFPARMNVTVKSTTLQRKKEDVAARTLQRSWRNFKAQRAMTSITYHAYRQKKLREQSHDVQLLTSAMTDLRNRLDAAVTKFFKEQRDSLISDNRYKQSDKKFSSPF